MTRAICAQNDHPAAVDWLSKHLGREGAERTFKLLMPPPRLLHLQQGVQFFMELLRNQALNAEGAAVLGRLRLTELTEGLATAAADKQGISTLVGPALREHTNDRMALAGQALGFCHLWQLGMLSHESQQDENNSSFRRVLEIVAMAILELVDPIPFAAFASVVELWVEKGGYTDLELPSETWRLYNSRLQASTRALRLLSWSRNVDVLKELPSLRQPSLARPC